MCLTPTTHQSKPRMQFVMPCMIDVEVFNLSLLQNEVLVFLCCYFFIFVEMLYFILFLTKI